MSWETVGVVLPRKEKRMNDDAVLAALVERIADYRPDWWPRAACLGVGHEVFFVERGVSTKPAKAFCAVCPVVEECRAYNDAASLGDWAGYGIWGGEAVKDRKNRYAVEAGVVAPCPACGEMTGCVRVSMPRMCERCKRDSQNDAVRRYKARVDGEMVA